MSLSSYQDDPVTYYAEQMPSQEVWTLQTMPEGLIYHSYMAGVKEPRCASVWSQRDGYGSGWDVALGGRIGLLRYGTSGCTSDRPDGWQVDLAGAVFARLDPTADSTPLVATDYRADIPITYGCGPLHVKLAYYHISSHLGDEYMLTASSFNRINYHRDALAFGVGYYYTDALRIYGEVGGAPESGGGAKPWEFQVGVDYSPLHTGLRGSPFWAVNAHSREDVGFGGNFVAQLGWQWRRTGRGGWCRMGMQYYTGKNEQYSFFDQNESRLGYGLWVDF